MKKIEIITPGKLILSGEHAVVYGAPACALAVNQTINGKYQKNDNDFIYLSFPENNIEEKIALREIFQLHQQLKERYLAFTQGKLNIREVIRHPIELCWFTIANTLIEINEKTNKGIMITLHSTIPLGCGMGSSAALILNLIQGINILFNLKLTNEKIFSLALIAENLQHGHSSGLDIKLSLYGGIHFFQKGRLTALDIDFLPFNYVNTGKPKSTTGECVNFVKEKDFHASLWKEFENTTLDFIDALRKKDLEKIAINIKKNHRLLCTIGVVPAAIQEKIALIEEQGGAAKICGAGSIRGETAGIILITNNIHSANAQILSPFSSPID